MGSPLACEGSSIMLVSSGYQGITKETTWVMGDGVQITNQDTVFHTYSESGTYQVILNVEVPLCGVFSKDTINIIVRPSPKIDFEIQPNIVCVGQEF